MYLNGLPRDGKVAQNSSIMLKKLPFGYSQSLQGAKAS